MDGNTLSGDALESALKDDTFSQSGYSVVGMVKAATAPKHIAFTNSGCDHWIDVPTDMISQAERVGTSPCKDHSHPLFRLTLNVPKDPQTEVLLALMSSSTSPAAGYGAPMPSPTGGDYSPPMMSPPGMTPYATMSTSPGPLAGASGGFGGQSQRLAGGGLGGGFGGGLNAWGCWDSTCAECTLRQYVCNGTACWWHCLIWVEKPCERCIWPW